MFGQVEGQLVKQGGQIMHNLIFKNNDQQKYDDRESTHRKSKTSDRL